MYHYLFAILSGILIGTIGLFVKLIGTEVHFATLIFFRFLIATIVLGIFMPLIDKNTFKIKKSDIKDYVIIGALFLINFALYIPANLLAPIQNVMLISSVYPFIVLGLAYFMLKEKITKTKIITGIIALIGLAIINPFQKGPHMLGNLIALLSGVFFAVLVVKMKMVDNNHSIGDVFWFFFFATILSAPLPIIFGLGNLANVWVYVLLLGLVSTALLYLFYNLALKKLESEIVSLIAIIVGPIAGIFLAHIFIGEVLNPRILIGGVLLVLAGVYLSLHKSSKTKI